MSAELEHTLSQMWAAGRAAWPGVEVGAAEYAEHVSRCGSTAGELSRLHAADLYLACACARDRPGALLAFERAYLAQVPAYVAGLGLSASQVDEVRQRLRERLLVAPAGASARIAGYAGRGALSGWVRVAALRVALALRQDEARLSWGPAGDVAAAELAQVAQLPGQELDLLRQHYREPFEQALREAFACLSSRQRNLLRLSVLHGLTGEQIGGLFHVRQATVSRWLAAARQAIYEETRRRLRERLPLSASDFQHLAALLQSRLDVSLVTLLRTSERVFSKWSPFGQTSEKQA
jgi:RNA polymerase sigma-70 factor (ECF subfamily)